MGTTIGLSRDIIKGDTRSLDYGSFSITAQLSLL